MHFDAAQNVSAAGPLSCNGSVAGRCEPRRALHLIQIVSNP